MNCIITSYNPLQGIVYYELLNVDCSFPSFRNYKWSTDKKKATLFDKEKAINILQIIGNPIPSFITRYVYNVKENKVEFKWK